MASPFSKLATAASAAIAVGLIGLAPPALAQQLALPPVIRIIVPFPPGGQNDLVARLIAERLGPRLGRSAIVENRPGGSTFIGAAAVSNAPKDGSVLLLVSVSMITAAATKPNPPIDILKDLLPITIISEGPTAIVASIKSGLRTPADLVAAARAKPDSITYGSVGAGTISHLAAELLAESANIQMRHIPYKGGGPATNDAMGGFVDLLIGFPAAPLMPQVKADKLRIIAVTSLEPNAAFPGVPAMASVVPGYESMLWMGVWAPPGTPAPIVQRMNQEINEIMRSQAIVDVLAQDAAVPTAPTPEQAAAKVRSALATWKAIAQKKGIVAD